MTRPAAEVVLGGRYRLTARIAGGGMGEVWAARDDVLGRDVAVKILHKQYADDPTFLERFRAEARHTAALSHGGIAAVYDFGEGTGDESPYLVMEQVPGEPLSALVAREGPLPPERTLDIVGQAAHALQAAHDAGVIHRDVKPGNILVTPDGTVKITDFGIARAANSVPLTQTGAIMGTAYYISPEQASGSPVTPASDIYSLGIVAYECLTGQRPFRGDTPVSVAMAQVRDQPPALPDTVPAPVRELVMRMLAKDPADRPAAAGGLGRDALALAAAAVAGPGPADGPGPVEATRVLPVAGVPGGGGPAYGSGETTTAVVADLPDDGPGGGWRRGPADTDPGFHLPAPVQLPRWVPFAVALGVGALLVLLLVRACGSADPGTVATTQDSPEASAPTSVQVVAEDYLGEPVDEARAELEGLGVRVEVVETAGGGTVGTVKAVAPTGEVAEGSLVTLTAVAAEPEDEGGEGGDEGGGDEEQDDKDDRPGKGKNNGKGKG